MKKSASMGNLSSAVAHNFPNHPCSPSDQPREHAAATASGYASDDPGHASCSSNCRNDRKKGTPWTEEEHHKFLLGLQKLGKGDWRGIARNFVISRTPTQVASHAQKYFIRQTNASRRKRRSSLFDMAPKTPIDHVPAQDGQLSLHSTVNESKNANKLHPCLHLHEASSSKPPPLPESSEEIQVTNLTLPLVPTFYPTLMPVPIQFWPTNLLNPMREEEMTENHEILKPTPILHKDITNTDEIVSMSMLSIGEGVVFSRIEPSALSIKLLEPSASRHSAFHMNTPISTPELNQNSGNVIHAV